MAGGVHVTSKASRPSHDKHSFADYVPALGAEMHIAALTVIGVMADTQWREFLACLASALGMTVCAAPAQWAYPMDGRGGNGLTIVQPITESFIAVETWPDHSGAYLLIVSCKPIAHRAVYQVVQDFELEMRQGLNHKLSLRN